MIAISKPFYTQTYIDRGNGPVVILLHGLFGNLSMWNKVVSSLENNFRVIIPRLPIFDLPAHHSNIEYLSTVLHEFLHWYRIKNVTLVGHELGGQIALKYTQLYPDFVSSLVLTGSSGLTSMLLSQDFENGYDYVHKKVKEAFFDGAHINTTMVDEVYDRLQDSSKQSAIKSLVQHSDQNNITSGLYRIDQPVLIVWGQQDKITPPSAAMHFHDILANAEVHFLDRCGHLPMVEHAQLFVQYLTSFLLRVSRNSA